eukprot:m.11371 g.11371  ORF g.11371 m.11371 type:complete len:337 (-) comp3827_c0_seq2:69-1079(-)
MNRTVTVTLQCPWGVIKGLKWPSTSPSNVPVRRVLAIHGWLDNANSFLPLMGEGKPDDMEVVAIDLPGHGLSTHKFPGFCYQATDWVKDVYIVSKALDWDKFHLIGHSMGAGVSMLFAATFPHKILSATFIDGMAPIHAEPEVAVSNLKNSIASWEALHKKKSAEPQYLTKEEAIGKLMKSNQHLDERSASILLQRGSQPVGEGKYAFTRDLQLKQASSLRLSFEHVRQFFRSLECPTCIILARDGIKFQQEENRKHILSLQQRLGKKFQFHQVDGTHHVHMIHPERVRPLWLKFLEGNATYEPPIKVVLNKSTNKSTSDKESTNSHHPTIIPSKL